MKNELIDAVKTAKSIHDGDYSSLHGKYFVIRGKIKKNHQPGDKPVDNSNEGNMTLTKLAKIVIDGFKRVDNRIDNLEKDINARINHIESRIDRIDARLDYIVKANNLKDSK